VPSATFSAIRAHTQRIVSGKSVLVVDDDVSMRGMVRSVLHHYGFEVDDAGSGNDAIALMNERSYDAVVLDVMMQDGSGHDVLHVLASTRPAVKCVVVVSATSLAKIADVSDANVVAKLRKPFDITELVAAVRRCMPSADSA
jgi:two-component system response regulator HydG